MIAAVLATKDAGIDGDRTTTQCAKRFQQQTERLGLRSESYRERLRVEPMWTLPDLGCCTATVGKRRNCFSPAASR